MLGGEFCIVNGEFSDLQCNEHPGCGTQRVNSLAQICDNLGSWTIIHLRWGMLIYK